MISCQGSGLHGGRSVCLRELAIGLAPVLAEQQAVSGRKPPVSAGPLSHSFSILLKQRLASG